MRVREGFRGTADTAPAPLRHFRDEDGLEYAGPHSAADSENCPWGFCDEMDFREYEHPYDAAGNFIGQVLKQPAENFGPGGDRPFCHTVDEESAHWNYFVKNKIFVKEIV